MAEAINAEKYLAFAGLVLDISVCTHDIQASWKFKTMNGNQISADIVLVRQRADSSALDLSCSVRGPASVNAKRRQW